MVLTRSHRRHTRSKGDHHKNCKLQCCYSPVKKTKKSNLKTNTKALTDDKVKKSSRYKYQKRTSSRYIEKQNIENHNKNGLKDFEIISNFTNDGIIEKAKITPNNILNSDYSGNIDSNFKTRNWHPSHIFDLKVPHFIYCSDLSDPKEYKSPKFSVLDSKKKVKEKSKKKSNSSSLLLYNCKNINEKQFPNILCKISKKLINTNKCSSAKCLNNSEIEFQDECQNKHKSVESNDIALKSVKKRFYHKMHCSPLKKTENYEQNLNIHKLLDSSVRSFTLNSSSVGKQTDTKTFLNHSQLRTKLSKKELEEKVILNSIHDGNLKQGNMKKDLIKVKKVYIFQNNSFILEKLPGSKTAINAKFLNQNVTPMIKDKIDKAPLSIQNAMKENIDSFVCNQAKVKSKILGKSHAQAKACPYCHKFASNNIEAFQGHIFKQHLMCHPCKQSFTSEEDVETHRMELHKREKQYCLVCERVLFSVPFYRNHIKSKVHEKQAALAENKALKEFFKLELVENHAETSTVESTFKDHQPGYFKNISSVKMEKDSDENLTIQTMSEFDETANSAVSVFEDSSISQSLASVLEPFMKNVPDSASSSQEQNSRTYENRIHNTEKNETNYFECLLKEEPKIPEIMQDYDDCMQSSFIHLSGTDVQNSISASYMDSKVSDTSLDSSALKHYCDNYLIPCESDYSKSSIQALPSYTELMPVKDPLSLSQSFLNYINANTEYKALVSASQGFRTQIVPNSSCFTDNPVSSVMYNQFNLF